MISHLTNTEIYRLARDSDIPVVREIAERFGQLMQEIEDLEERNAELEEENFELENDRSEFLDALKKARDTLSKVQYP